VRGIGRVDGVFELGDGGRHLGVWKPMKIGRGEGVRKALIVMVLINYEHGYIWIER
jgi:hypothetical protein